MWSNCMEADHNISNMTKQIMIRKEIYSVSAIFLLKNYHFPQFLPLNLHSSHFTTPILQLDALTRIMINN